MAEKIEGLKREKGTVRPSRQDDRERDDKGREDRRDRRLSLDDE